MKAGQLKFDSATHAYSDELGPLSGVTSLLSQAGLIDFSMIPENMRDHYMDRGSKVHLATELYDEGDLDEATLDPILKKYFEGYKKFKADYGERYKIVSMEGAVRHPLQRYAGRFDRLCTIDGELSILDIKTGGLQNWTALQIEAYRLAFESENKEKIKGRYALQLKKDGKYLLKKYSDPYDTAAWLAVVTLARWKASHGV